MSWSDVYIGIPWRAGGRHDDGHAGGNSAGLDCWGLLRRIYAEQLQLRLPSFDGTDALDGAAIAATMQGNMSAWREVAVPQPFDGVLLRKGRDLCHVGVVVRGRQFLHVDSDCAAQIERLDSPLWRRRFIGFYRHAAQQ
jgi:cell wall-associated NlpC family hydrolase